MKEAIQGICSPLVVDGALPGEAWLHQLDELRPGQPLAIRGSLNARPDGTVDVELYKRSLNLYRTRGHKVYLLAEANIGQKEGVNPNDAPYEVGNAASNAWVDSYSLTLCDTLIKLGEECPETVIVANETNIVNPHLAPGDAIPSNKPEALSPQIAALLTWQAATRIRNLCPRVQTTLPAAMSDLVAFDTSVDDGWIGGWVREQMDYLLSLGLTAPWPFESLLLNQEGILTDAYEAYIFGGVGHLKAQYDIAGPTIITEWGSGVAPENEEAIAAMQQSFEVVKSYAEAMFFYCFGQDKGYGTHGPSRIVGATLVPGQPTEWYSLLREWYVGTI